LHPLTRNKGEELFTPTGKYGLKIYLHRFVRIYGTLTVAFARNRGKLFIDMLMK
jgi:hypothetical protein